MGDNEVDLLSIECVYRVKECTPARFLHLIRPMVNSTFLLGLRITVLK